MPLVVTVMRCALADAKLEELAALFACGDDYTCNGVGVCQWRPPLNEELRVTTRFGTFAEGAGSGCICNEGFAGQICQVTCPRGNTTTAETPNGTRVLQGKVCSGKLAGVCSPLNGTCLCTKENDREHVGVSCTNQCPRGTETCVRTRLGITECTPQVCSGMDIVSSCPEPYRISYTEEPYFAPWPCEPIYMDDTMQVVRHYQSKRGVCEFKQNATLNPVLDDLGCHETHAFKERCRDGSKDPYTGLSIGQTSCRCRYDVRGWNCTLDCPKDELGRICSLNGTCTEEAICICVAGYYGRTCEYKILNDTYMQYPHDATQVVTKFEARICSEGPKRQKSCRFDLDCGYDCAPGLTNCFQGWTALGTIPGPSGDELIGVDYDRCRDATGFCRRKRVFNCRNVEVCNYGPDDPRTEDYFPCIASDWQAYDANPKEAVANGYLPFPCDYASDCQWDLRNCTRDSDEPRACIPTFSVNSATFDTSTRITVRPPLGEVVGGLTLQVSPSQVLELRYEQSRHPDAPASLIDRCQNQACYPPYPTARTLPSMSSGNWIWNIIGFPPQQNTTVREHLVMMYGGAGRPATNIVMITNAKTLLEEPEIVTQQAISSEVWRWNHSTTEPHEPVFLQVYKYSHPRKAYGGVYDKGMEFGHWRLDSPTPFEERSAIPPKRYGHSLTLINGGLSALLFGGYSTVCADYCKDLWEYHLVEKRWSFKNMTPAASINPVYTTSWDVMNQQNLTEWRTPPKRWQHTMTVRSETSIVLFGGFFTQGIGEGWLNDVWEYTFAKAPQTLACVNYDVGKGSNYIPASCPDQLSDLGYWTLHYNQTHHVKDDVEYENEPNAPMIQPRRGHAAAFVNGFLYVFGGQVQFIPHSQIS